MYDITDQRNVEMIAQMIAAETTGLSNAEPEDDDVELALITAGFIKHIINITHSGCIVRGKTHDQD